MEFVDVGAVSEIAQGRPKHVKVSGRDLVICRTEEGFFALDDKCPHRGGPLSDGDLLGNEIVCPWHLWGFDVRSGVCTGNSEVTIAKHHVRIEADRLLVALAPADVPTGQEQ